MDASRIAMSVVSMPYPDFSHTHSCFATPSQQTRLFYWVGTSLLFIPFWSLPSPPPNVFPILVFQWCKRREKESSETLYTHISIQKQNSPNSATSKVIDALHLRAKVAAAISWDQLHICKQASKQGGGTERYLIFLSLLLTIQIGFHLLICNVSLFVCFFLPWRLRQEDFLVNGWDGFSGLSGCQAAFMKLHSFVGHWLVWKKKEGKREDSFEGFFAFSSVT